MTEHVNGFPVVGPVQPEVNGENQGSQVRFPEGEGTQNVDTNVNSQNLGSGSSGAYAQIDNPDSVEAGLDF
jgi:hypothetical protein